MTKTSPRIKKFKGPFWKNKKLRIRNLKALFDLTERYQRGQWRVNPTTKRDCPDEGQAAVAALPTLMHLLITRYSQEGEQKGMVKDKGECGLRNGTEWKGREASLGWAQAV